jgi:hypothetical protein
MRKRNPGTSAGQHQHRPHHARQSGQWRHPVRPAEQPHPIQPSLQSLTLLEGRSGFIQAVQSRPLPWVMLTPQGGILRGSSVQDAITGFYARPRLNGKRVSIELAVSQQAFSGVQRTGSQLSTTVEGQLGEWLEVARTTQDSQGRESLLIGGSQQQGRQSHSVRIRVQALP